MRTPLLLGLLFALSASGGAQRVVRSNGSHGDVWSFDGRRILGCLGNDVCLWDAATGRLIHRMRGHGNFLYSVAMSPDGKLAASSSWAQGEGVRLDPKDTNARIWDLGTGRQLALLDGQVNPRFSPDGRRIVTFAAAKGREKRRAASVWEAESGRHVASLELDPYTSIAYASLSFSPDGTRILIQEEKSLTVYDVADGRRLSQSHIAHPSHSWIGASFADAHERVAAAGDNGFTIEQLGRLTTDWLDDLPNARMEWVAWSAEATRAVGIGGDWLCVWDTRHGTVRKKKLPLGLSLRAFVTPSGDRTLIIHHSNHNEGFDHFSLVDAERSTILANYAPGPAAEFLGFSPDGASFLILRGIVRQYRSRDGALLREFAIEGVPTERPGEQRAR